mmetsp:Transcript_79622/g.110207  ORF Transcript_79622/g.110207 Transcript_79622/m.110207 type:complete len:107 (-) Transcript_79622:565-885(-)
MRLDVLLTVMDIFPTCCSLLHVWAVARASICHDANEVDTPGASGCMPESSSLATELLAAHATCPCKIRTDDTLALLPPPASRVVWTVVKKRCASLRAGSEALRLPM